EGGEVEGVMVGGEGNRGGGEHLLEDEFAWFAAANFHHKPGERLRLAMLAAPCGVRAHAIRTLDRAKIKWVEAFTGGGVTAVVAAVTCGPAVAPPPRPVVPPRPLDAGPALALPPLGRSKVALHSRTSDAHARAALRTLAAAFRSMAPG